MDPILIASLGMVGMFALILLHIPIGIAMAVAGFVGFGVLSGFGPAASLFATEPVGVIDKNRIGVGNIQAGFDYRSADQDIGFAENKIYHRGLELVFAHPAVRDIELDVLIVE